MSDERYGIENDRDLLAVLYDSLDALDAVRDRMEKDPEPWSRERTLRVEFVRTARRRVCRAMMYVERRRRFVDAASLEERELVFDLTRRALAGFLFELHEENPYTVSMAFLVDWAQSLERRDPDAMQALRALLTKLEPELQLPPRRQEVLDVEGRPAEGRKAGGGEPDTVCHWCGAETDPQTVRTGASGTYCSLRCDVEAARASAAHVLSDTAPLSLGQARELVEGDVRGDPRSNPRAGRHRRRMSNEQDNIDRLQQMLKTSMEESEYLRRTVRAMADRLHEVCSTVVESQKSQHEAMARIAEAAEEYSSHRSDEHDLSIRIEEEGSEYGLEGFRLSVEIPVFLIRTEDKGALDLLAKARAAVEDAARRRSEIHEHRRQHGFPSPKEVR